jgi:hypothetical protein
MDYGSGKLVVPQSSRLLCHICHAEPVADTHGNSRIHGQLKTCQNSPSHAAERDLQLAHGATPSGLDHGQGARHETPGGSHAQSQQQRAESLHLESVSYLTTTQRRHCPPALVKSRESDQRILRTRGDRDCASETYMSCGST